MKSVFDNWKYQAFNKMVSLHVDSFGHPHIARCGNAQIFDASQMGYGFYDVCFPDDSSRQKDTPEYRESMKVLKRLAVYIRAHYVTLMIRPAFLESYADESEQYISQITADLTPRMRHNGDPDVSCTDLILADLVTIAFCNDILLWSPTKFKEVDLESQIDEALAAEFPEVWATEDHDFVNAVRLLQEA